MLDRSTVSGEFAAHWRVVVASSIGVGVGPQMFSFVQSIFITHMQAAFGWSRGDIAFALAGLLVASATAPLVGMAIDRFGVRPVVFISTVGVAAGFVALANINHNIWSYYIAFNLLILIGAGTTPISFARAISTWFDNGLGLALAIALSGVSVSAFLLPPLLTAIIGTYGWRAGYWFLALVPLVIGLPTSWLWLRERATAPGVLGGSVFGKTAGQALVDRRFWILCAAITLVTVPAISLSTQLQPLLTDKGFSEERAAGLMSVFAVAVLVGRLIVGRLIDRFWAPGVAFVTLMITASGAFMLMGHSGSTGLAALALILLGIAQGAELNLLAFLIARYFGTRSFSAIYGNINVVFGLSIACGAVMFGKLFDIYGNYDLALQISGACLIGSALLFPLMGRYPQWTPAA